VRRPIRSGSRRIGAPAGKDGGEDVANSQAYNCRVGVSPGKGTARGVFEMRNGAGTSLTNVELR
jgi:hypothetical protein